MTAHMDALFDLKPSMVTPRAPASRPARIEWDRLEQFAFCYTATELGNNSGVRFMCSLDDAMRWCEAPESRGQLHGTRWAYFWTRVDRFLRHYSDFTGAQRPTEVVFRYTGDEDNGEWDERLVAAGVTTKVSPIDAVPLLESLGVKCVNIKKQKAAA